MGKVKNNKKKQMRVNATGVPTNAEIEEAENLQRVPVETILPLIQKVDYSTHVRRARWSASCSRDVKPYQNQLTDTLSPS